MFDNFFSADFWQNDYFGNILQDYTIAVGVLIAVMITFKIFQVVLLNRLKTLAKKTKTDIDDILIEIVGTIRPRLYIYVAFYIALKTLTFSSVFISIIDSLIIILVVFWVIKAVQILIEFIVRKRMGEEDDRNAKAAASIIALIAKFVLWAFGLLFILQNLGVNVTSLIAGLGIGGIAVALAAQNILSDLFSSFAIYFDKPFMPGDFIIVGTSKGHVEKIGIKTTRIKSISGEEIVLSNQELTSAQIKNYGKIKERRAELNLGVTYDTPTEKMKAIPGMIKEIIEHAGKTRFDRAHFAEFGDSALIVKVVYYIQVGEYGKFMDIQQEVNVAIKETFEEKGIEFAYPTQTVYVEK